MVAVSSGCSPAAWSCGAGAVLPERVVAGADQRPSSAYLRGGKVRDVRLHEVDFGRRSSVARLQPIRLRPGVDGPAPGQVPSGPEARRGAEHGPAYPPLGPR